MYLGVNYISEISTVNGLGFVVNILEGNDYQFNYEITLTRTYQEESETLDGCYGNRYWKFSHQLLTTTTKKLQRKLKKKIDTHSELGIGYHKKTKMGTSM